ncbi:UbiA prenyltransferase [Annulohypoxylon bovei var. microspora]|nr:UbiA prenyltransferase [Annulohypoxylon bovei var. microspora]
MSEKPASPPSSISWHSRLHNIAIPYLQLMRLDRPNGYWYFWYPHVFGTLWAAIQQRSRPRDLLLVNLILLWGVLVMRGATCTWNDTVDVDFDRKVSRCRNRPLARGAISIMQANLFTAAQTLASLATMTLLPPLCVIYAAPAVVGWFCYPLAKRVTYYPQVVLGFPMAWGIYMGAASMGADPLHFAPLLDTLMTVARRESTETWGLSLILEALQQVRVEWPITAFYAANVVWTLLYELVYSHQDAAEDTAAGVKNLVLLYVNPNCTTPEERFGTMPLLCRLAVAQVLFLAAAGTLGSFGLGYSAVAVAGTAAALATMLSRVRLEEPESCAWWFRVGNAKYAGRAMVAGLTAEYVGRILLQ